jgi:hypothetical protein
LYVHIEKDYQVKAVLVILPEVEAYLAQVKIITDLALKSVSRKRK